MMMRLTCAPLFRARVPIFIGLVVLFLATPSHADTNSVFVSFKGGSTSSSATPAQITISNQGSGWNYSAAAQFPGTNWNQFLRPSTLIGDGTSNSTLGATNYLQTVSNSPLCNPVGSNTAITLSGALTIVRQDSSSTRTEPNTGTWGSNALSPVGLNNDGWRIYRYENFLTWTFANLETNANYLLYVYGAYVSGTNYAGCFVRLTNANVPAGGASFLDVQGSTNGYVFQNSGGVISPVTPAAAGVSNTLNQSPWGVIPAVSDGAGKLVFNMTRPGVNYTGNTFATNSAANATITGTGGYWFSGFQLIPYPLPSITLQPSSSPIATLGDTVSLTVTTTNWYTSTNLTYQWRKGGTNLSNGPTGTGATYAGSTSSLLTISNAQTGDAGDYTVVVRNPGGTVTSTVSALAVSNVVVAPSIASQPSDQTVAAGTPVTLTVSANGSSPLGYQWQKSADGGISWTNTGSNASTFTIASPTVSDSGLYRVTVSNSGGSLTSSQATLTVTQLTISTQPTGVVTLTDSSQTIGVTVTANPPPSYQWQKSVDGLNWTNVAGGTGSSLSANLTATNSGFYRVIASNSVGSVTSSIVMAGVVSTNLGNAVLSPTNGSAAVNRDTPLRLTFASPPVVGSAGTIRVYDAASNTLVASYDLGAMTVRAGTTTGGTNYGVFHYQTRVINGDSVLHTPVISLGSQPGPGRLPAAPAGYDTNAALISLPSSTNLAYGRTYYVLMDPGTFVDSQGAPFAGITNTNAWTFTVKSSGPAAGSTNLIVGNDGTPTDFSTLQGAADFVPTGNSNATVVSLRQGFYPEVVHWKSPNVTISGQGRTNTVIAWINNNNINPSTSTRPVMNVVASNVCLRDLSVYNMTPYGGSQAESLYTVGNAIVLNRVGLYSYQDTLLANTGSLFVTDSYIEGATDYIWGYAASYFQRCELKANTNGAYYTQARNSQTSRGFSFVNCTLDAYPGVTNSSATLSRTFGSSAPFSQTAYVNCRMGPHIQPAGWYINDTTNTNATLQLWEYQSRDLSNNALNVSQRAAFNRSFSVSGTNIVYTAGQTNSPDVLTNGQISAALAALMTNWSNQLGGWVPAAATPDPVMVPRFGSNIAAYQNSEFRDPGATLADPVDGTVTLYSTTPVSTAALGSLTITYPGYTNSLNIVYSGTSAVVTVVTNAPPVLNGSSNITAVWGAGFADPGATIVDPYSGTQTVYGTENGLPLDTSRLGSHTLTYVYTNSQGEVTAPVQRTVVVDTVVPALPVFGTNSYDITVPNPSINGGSPASTNNSTNANATAINAYINFCSTNGGGTVTVPDGTFNTGLVTLLSNVNLRLSSNAVLKAASYTNQLISSKNATNIAITGSGALDGGATTNAGSINLIVLTSCTRILIQGVTIMNAGHEHLVIQFGRDVTVDGIDLNDNGTLAANGGNYLANTDGIDYYGTNFLFKNCTIADGDDNIVAKPLGSGCANITITNCTATAGHGFGIGGGMLYGVSCFLVTDSTLSGTAYGVRIKAQDNPNFDQGGLVSNAVYRNITMSNVRRPLILESYYDGTDNYPSSPTDTNNYTLLFSQFATNGYTYYPTYYSAIPRTNTPYTPTFKNISFINVTASNAVYPGNFEGGWYTTPNIDGLTFSNVTVQTTSTSRGFNIWHATNVTAYNLRILTPTNNAYYGTNSNRPISGVYSYDVGNFSVSAPLIPQAFFTFNAADTNGTYNGAAQPVGVTVDPADALPVIVTYSGSNGMVYGPTTNAPVNAGSYTVTATTPNTNYTGSGTATLVIAPATPTFVFDSNSLSATYTGSGIAVSLSGAGSTPVTISYDFDTYLAVTAGTHTVVATVTDTNNYSPYSVTNTLTIAKATALVTLSGMSQPFNNTPRSVTVGTSPTNLEVGVTYNGSPTAPSAVGSYAVTASVVDANYAGSNTGTLVIYDPAGRWRSNAFGTTNNSGSAADSAIGSSGLANQQAYALGIDPNSPSTNVPLACTASGTNFSVSFTAKTAGTDPGYGGLTRYYTLEGTTNLIDSNSWSSIGGYSNIEATNQTVIYSTNTTGAAKWFYRLRVWLQ